MIRKLLFCLFLELPIIAFAQKDCPITKNLGGKYRFVDSSTDVIEGRKVFFLTIGLAKDKFSEDYLRSVARRVNQTYCHEQKIDVVILDVSDKRKFDDLTPPPIFPPATRAIYSIDRETKVEKLNFFRAEKIGKEIKIEDGN